MILTEIAIMLNIYVLTSFDYNYLIENSIAMQVKKICKQNKEMNVNFSRPADHSYIRQQLGLADSNRVKGSHNTR